MFFYDSYVAVQYTPAHYDSNHVDWRCGLSKKDSFQLIELPTDIEKLCSNLLADLGIHFGIFDIAVDFDGLYYFLELNPSGQFLYVEEILPESRILEKCANAIVRFVDKSVAYQTNKSVTLSVFQRDYVENNVGIGNGAHFLDAINRRSMAL